MSEKKGKIFRQDGKTVVQYGDKEKAFTKKPVFFGRRAFEQAMDTYLRAKRAVVLAMNGYSSLTPEQCKTYGVKFEGYETACASVLAEAIRVLLGNFSGIQVRLAHGASGMGVDKAVINVGRKLNIPQLGFSCPAYMFYVADDDIPVYVAPTEKAYCDAFTNALDILITANGRKTTFEMDIDAVFKKHKDVIPVNIMRAISTMGGPLATDEDGNIEDAVAFWYLKMHHVAAAMGISGVDSWENVKESVASATKQIVRRMMPPNVAFGYEWHHEINE